MKSPSDLHGSRSSLRLLAQEVEALADRGPRGVGVELDVVADRVGREEPVDAARGDQLLGDDAIEQRVALSEDLPRLLAGRLVLEDSGYRPRSSQI